MHTQYTAHTVQCSIAQHSTAQTHTHTHHMKWYSTRHLNHLLRPILVCFTILPSSAVPPHCVVFYSSRPNPCHVPWWLISGAQVKESAESLTSEDVFVLVTPLTVYVWKGELPLSLIIDYWLLTNWLTRPLLDLWNFVHSIICNYSVYLMCYCLSLISLLFFSFSSNSYLVTTYSTLHFSLTFTPPSPSTPSTFYQLTPFSHLTTLSYPHYTTLSYLFPLTTPPYGALLLHPTGVASLPSEAAVADSIAQALATNYNNSGKLYKHYYIITHVSLLIYRYWYYGGRIKWLLLPFFRF